jgi:hypothetical protein
MTDENKHARMGGKMMQEKKKTYFTEAIKKYASEYTRKFEEKSQKLCSLGILFLTIELIFQKTTIECLNELDSRLRKLEKES